MSGYGFHESDHYDEKLRRRVRDEYLDDPLFTALINLANLIAVMGGSLAVIFAVGYAGRGIAGWGPDVLILAGLLAANVALRVWRAHRRRAKWRRYHPDQPQSQRR